MTTKELLNHFISPMKILKVIKGPLLDLLQCLLFWIATLLVTKVAICFGFIHLQERWFIPFEPFIAALILAAITYALEWRALSSKTSTPTTALRQSYLCLLTTALRQPYLSLLRSCNRNIGTVCSNSAVIFILIYYLDPEMIPKAVLLSIAALGMYVFSLVLEQRSTPKEQTSPQK